VRRTGRERALGLIVALALAQGLGLAGCYYRKYDPLVRTHVELMLALAAKRRDLAVREGVPPNPSEFSYPLERARDFARIVRDRFDERPSYRAFEAFLERYAAFLASAAKPDADPETLGRDVAELRAKGQVVIAALDREAS
jgi:hypothetical protein